MKKIFTLLVLMLAVLGAKAADTELLNLDFSQSPYVGQDFPSDGTTLGIVYSKGSGAKVSSDGVVTYHTGGNMSSSRNFGVGISGVNKTVSIKFILSSKGQKVRYNVVESDKYDASNGGSKIADLTAGDDGTITVDYNMSGNGSAIFLYFGQGSSSYTSGLKGIIVTTPNGSVTKSFTSLSIDGVEMNVDDWNVLDSQGSIDINTAFDHIPVVKYVVTTTTIEGDNTTVNNDEYTAEVVKDGDNYKASFTVEGQTYNVIFTNVTVVSVLVVTGETTIVLTKENITSQAYLSTTTNDWQANKTYAGYTGDFYNMSSTNRMIKIEVEGAKYIEAFVQNSTAGRTYKLNDETITHTGKGVESSGLIAISNGTVILAGGGSSVYPVYVKFYTEYPPISVTIPASGYATLCSSNDVVSNGECYKATKLVNGVVTIVPVQGVIPSGTGIIVKGEAGTVTLPIATEGTTEADLSDNKMVGVLTDTDMTGKSCYILSDGAFYPCSGGTLAAGKAYLDIAPTSGAKAIEIDVDGQETAISTVNAEQLNGNIYTINGVQVKNAQLKGIYIINGKKVVK